MTVNAYINAVHRMLTEVASDVIEETNLMHPNLCNIDNSCVSSVCSLSVMPESCNLTIIEND